MKRFLCIALLGMLGAATLAGCADDSHGSYSKTTVKRESPSGDTTYERKTETKTTINP